jgi:DNA-binding MarR family transcriptional regulator
LHQAYNLILKSENKVFSQYGISAEQHAVLMAIKHIKPPVTPTDVAKWLDRNPNGISIILYRMAKSGFVREERDLQDRRSVRLVITEKGKEILDRATVAGWELTQEVLSSMNEEDVRTLVRLLDEVREMSFKYLNPGEDIKLINVNEEKNMARFIERMAKHSSFGKPETPESNT